MSSVSRTCLTTSEQLRSAGVAPAVWAEASTVVGVNSPRGRAACAAAVLLLAAACASGPDGSSVASGDGEIATTAPLAVPPNLQAGGQGAPAAVATTAPATPPTVAAVEAAPTVAPAAAEPAEVVDEPTAVALEEATAVPEPEPDPTAVPQAEPEATAVPATAIPQPAATAVPATAVPQAAEPAAEPTVEPAPAPASGTTIVLGDYDVVNLNTGATQNIGELSPTGKTMLWFWAPH